MSSRRLFSGLLAVMLMAAAWAQGVRGSITRVDGPVIEVRLPSGADVRVRDVFAIMHGGQAVGEAMVTSVRPRVSLLAKGSLKPAVGDDVIFARRPAMPSSGLESWVEYADAREGFRVKFPSTPKRESSGYNTTVGVCTKRVASAKADHVLYEVTVLDYEKFHQNGEKNYLEGDLKTTVWTGLTTVWKRPIELSGVPGLDVEARGWKGIPMRVRVFHRGMRAWIVCAQAEEDHDLTGDVASFMESFHFVP